MSLQIFAPLQHLFTFHICNKNNDTWQKSRISSLDPQDAGLLHFWVLLVDGAVTPPQEYNFLSVWSHNM